MASIVETLTGSLSEKRRWHSTMERAKRLPDDYRTAFEEIKKYWMATSGLETIDPFEALVELFEEGAANERPVLQITGADVAAFADELVFGEKNWIERHRVKLNQALINKLGKDN